MMPSGNQSGGTPAPRPDYSSSGPALVAAIGAGSSFYARVIPEFLQLFSQVSTLPGVSVRYRTWRSLTSTASDHHSFVRQTYAAIVARFVARLFLEPGRTVARPEDLRDTINGDHFRSLGINNFIEDDFFTWVLHPGIEEQGLELVGGLSDRLQSVDLGHLSPNLINELYANLVDVERPRASINYNTPRWLAEYLLIEELSLSRQPDLRLLDPACGLGLYLASAVRIIAEAGSQQGQNDLDCLLRVLDQVMGMTTDPLGVTFARTSYLLALGDLIKEPHPPMVLPVYLSDATPPPVAQFTAGGEPVYEVSVGAPPEAFYVPESVANNLEMLDWVFFRLPNYLKGAGLRRQNQSQEDATQEVLNAFYNYLVSPKPRTPVPVPLSTAATEVMIHTARRLIELYYQGEDHLWLYPLKNIPAAAYMARRKFDIVISDGALGSGDTRTSPSADFLRRWVDLYLNDTGRIAILGPAATPDSLQNSSTDETPALQRTLDLSRISSLCDGPAYVAIAQRGATGASPTPSSAILVGLPPQGHASWEEASSHIKVFETGLPVEPGE